MKKPQLDTTTIPKGRYKVLLNYKGYIRCPECGKRTHVKVLPNTMLENFPLWCEHCKKEFIIDY